MVVAVVVAEADAVVLPSDVIVGVSEDVVVDSTVVVVIINVVGGLLVANEGKLELEA